jgi:hypothetical protein
VRTLVVAASILALALLARRASAHATGLSTSEVVVSPSGSVRATLVFAAADAARVLRVAPGVLREPGGMAEGALASLEGRAEVRSDGSLCSHTLVEGHPTEGDGYRFVLAWSCGPPARDLSVHLAMLEELEPQHRHLARLDVGGATIDALVTPASPSFGWSAAPRGGGAGSSLLAAMRAGIEHILTGWDHLLFLLALLLGLRRAGPLAAAISAFTVAHSITLALAALGLVAAGPRWVEPAIAASIAFVAVENLAREPASHRWRMAFLFGLVHGFGFAGALRQLAVSRERLVPTLFGFNLGVELGQLCVVALVLPLLALTLRGRRREPEIVRALSVAVGAAGAIACVARIVSR